MFRFNFFLDKNLVLNLTQTIFVAGVSLLFTIFIAREIGVEDFGVYSYLVSIINIIYIFQSGGFRTLIYKTSIKNDKRDLFSAAFIYSLTVTIFICILIYLFHPNNEELLIIAVLSSFLLAIYDFISSKLKGKNLFKEDAIWKILIRSFSVLFVVACLYFFQEKDKLNVIFYGWLVSLLILFFWPLKKKYINFSKAKINKNIFSISGSLFLIDLSTVIYFRSDIVMLENLLGIGQVLGEYAASHRFIEGLILLSSPISVVAFRKLAISKDKSIFFKILKFYLKILIILGFFACLLLFFLSNFLIGFLYGENYNNSIYLLQIMSFSMLFIFPNGILMQALLALDQQKIYIKIVVTIAALNIILNYIFIPFYGAYGAIWTTIFTESLLFILLLATLLNFKHQNNYHN